MKPLVILALLLLPVAGSLYHWGPGQQKLILDDAGNHLRLAERFRKQGDLGEEEFHLRSALPLLPEDRIDEKRRIRLRLAQIWLNTERLPDAWTGLHALLAEDWESGSDMALQDEVRDSLAQTRYYLTWLMRLEGRPRNEWEPEIEAARQTYRYLAEKATEQGSFEQAKKQSENLESAIRLARMDIDELQGLALPSQCKGCCSGQCKGKGKKPGKKKKSNEEDARGASSGPPPDKGGS